MTVRPIVLYPDPRLSQIAEPVTFFDASLAGLAQDLLDTLRDASGIGIAGPHIGVLARVFVVQIAHDQPVWTCVNPVVVSASADSVRHLEGSISLPGAAEQVERPTTVTVAYQDLEGERHEVEATGFLGVCFQHEIDQLDGLFWLKRLSRLKRDRLLKRHAKQH
ncbi:MAG: peptide deformylase [Ancalomicrobiaceae bacterium]|nr:peptide deformylase [Ancalomicrobiaceae bacterium]